MESLQDFRSIDNTKVPACPWFKQDKTHFFSVRNVTNSVKIRVRFWTGMPMATFLRNQTNCLVMTEAAEGLAGYTEVGGNMLFGNPLEKLWITLEQRFIAFAHGLIE
jgi:hypothetical protein